jgi:aspartate/methionine/tyrosine aminotransferase
MYIEPFGVEQWMNRWENHCELNLAETCVDSLTVDELLAIAGSDWAAVADDLGGMKLTYGAIIGSEALRSAVAALYARQGADNVLITHGTIGANHLLYSALVGAGDHVLSITPTYQQHTAIPRALGAEVTELPLRPERGWLPELAALERALRPATRLIALTNPNNPTGALIEREGLERLVALARERGAWLLCDEVYRGTEQGERAPSIADLYERGISTGSTSKAFSLAGLRLGWIVGPAEVLEAVEVHRDYSTISVSMVDDYFATLALRHADRILARSRDIVRRNLARLEAWVDAEPRAGMVTPRAGTTALVAIDTGLSSRELCERLLSESGVLFTPGSAMGMEGYLRIGYACATEDLDAGLARVSAWLRERPPAAVNNA